MIRDARLEDVPALVAMGQRFRAEFYAQTLADNPAQMAAQAAQLVESPDGLLLVDDDGAGPIGMIGVLIFPHYLSGERVAAEMFWYVEPARRGIGVRLLKRAERWAGAAGAVRMYLIAPTRTGGLLYERLGYAWMEAAYTRTLTGPVQVWDDVVPDPLAYRAAALAQPFQSVAIGPDTFHGIAPADPQLPAWIGARCPDHRPTLTFFRRSPAGQVEPHYVHSDRGMGDWTGLLYLTVDPPAGDGTTFWRHRDTGAMRSTAATPAAEAAERDAYRDPAQWVPWRTVAARFNRLVLFEAALFHSRALVENYGAGADARLVQVVFGRLGEDPAW